MAIRTGHGNGAGVPRIETLPVDELPVGVPGPARPEAVRDGSGRFTPGAGTSELARAGGKAAAESRQLAALLGLWTPPDDHAFAPYARLSREWRDSYMAATVSATIAGGEADEGAAVILSSAALQVGASRFLFDEGAKNGDAKMLLEASRLADAARQNVLAAFELAARAALARKAANPGNAHARALATFSRPAPKGGANGS